jgi:hypothetical protein
MKLDEPRKERAGFVARGPLVFLTLPSPSCPVDEDQGCIGREVNTGQLALRSNADANTATITIEEFLFAAHVDIERGLKHKGCQCA